MIKFKSFSSGSCGNAYWLGITDEQGRHVASVLIDGGVSPRRVKREMITDGLSIEQVGAILVTHNHYDHIRSLGSFGKSLQVPIWSTDIIHQALAEHALTREWVTRNRKILRSREWNEIVPGHIEVRYFVVPHDAAQTVGFAIRLDESFLYVHITDCGRVTPEALEWCSKANALTLESNYDPYMLTHGSYPPELQERIMGGNGHISNEECAETLSKAMHPDLKTIFLCHLSENNNTPQKAYEVSRRVVPEGVRLQALPRQTPSALFNLF